MIFSWYPRKGGYPANDKKYIFGLQSTSITHLHIYSALVQVFLLVLHLVMPGEEIEFFSLQTENTIFANLLKIWFQILSECWRDWIPQCHSAFIRPKHFFRYPDHSFCTPSNISLRIQKTSSTFPSVFMTNERRNSWAYDPLHLGKGFCWHTKLYRSPQCHSSTSTLLQSALGYALGPLESQGHDNNCLHSGW